LGDVGDANSVAAVIMGDEDELLRNDEDAGTGDIGEAICLYRSS
jgi:hypothetical protein